MDLASSFQAEDCVFFVRGNSKKIHEIFSHTHFTYEVIPESASFTQQFQFIDSKVFGAWLVFVDLSYTQTYTHAEEAVGFLNKLSESGHRVVLIDGLDADAAYSRSRDLDIHTLLTPYCSSESLVRNFQHLHGPEYFIFNQSKLEEYSVIRKNRAVPEKARHILVAMGRSDSYNLSIFAMRALLDLPESTRNETRVRVIIGSHFSSKLMREISALEKKNPDFFQIDRVPESNFEEFFWCDLAITTSGLMKYQLAFTGAPMIIIPHHKTSELSNFSFSQSGTNVTLPRIENLSQEQLLVAVSKLIGDQLLRKKMSRIGIGLVDGMGNRRILDSILNPSPSRKSLLSS